MVAIKFKFRAKPAFPQLVPIKQNSCVFQFQGTTAFLMRGAWHDTSALFSWIVIANAFNLIFVLCLHKHRILEESSSTSTQELIIVALRS